MLWKDSAPKGWKKKKKKKTCLSTPHAGLGRRICVEKVSMRAHTDTHTHTWEAILESWEGSEFTVRRGPRRSLTDCFKDVAGGCWVNKDNIIYIFLWAIGDTGREEFKFIFSPKGDAAKEISLGITALNFQFNAKFNTKLKLYMPFKLITSLQLPLIHTVNFDKILWGKKLEIKNNNNYCGRLCPRL